MIKPRKVLSSRREFDSETGRNEGFEPGRRRRPLDALLGVTAVLLGPLGSLRAGAAVADDRAVVRGARVVGQLAVLLLAGRLLLCFECLYVVLARFMTLGAAKGSLLGVFESSQVPSERLTSGTHLDEFHGLHFGSLYMRSTCRGVKTSVTVLWSARGRKNLTHIFEGESSGLV